MRRLSLRLAYPKDVAMWIHRLGILCALAATIYRMLTGRHPIEARKFDEWLQAIRDVEPPPANEINSDIPERISQALARALAKEPDQRQPSMTDFRADLGL